jgi:hypothetical protein
MKLRFIAATSACWSAAVSLLSHTDWLSSMNNDVLFRSQMTAGF